MQWQGDTNYREKHHEKTLEKTQCERGKKICLAVACVAVTACSTPSLVLEMDYKLDINFPDQYNPERSELQGESD